MDISLLLQNISSIASSGLEFGLLNALMVVGLAIAFRFANFPDLTIEGTIIIGSVVTALGISHGCSPLMSIFFGAFVGAVAGMTTATLHILTGMSKLLAGIIMMTVLYSLSLRLMNGSNLSLYGLRSWYSGSSGSSENSLLSAVIVLPLLLLLTLFLKTEFGLLLRATGENKHLVLKLGKPHWVYLLTSLAMANSLIGIAGAMIAQSNQFADIGFGAGTIITGLAALIIGESILVPTSVARQMSAAVIGSIVYYTIFALALRLGLHPWDLKLASAGIVLIAILISKNFSNKMDNKRIGCDPL